MKEENEIRKAMHDLQKKYRENSIRRNTFETDAYLKFNNAELLISGIGGFFTFSIGYSEPFKEIVISKYDISNTLTNNNFEELFAKLYTDLMEFIDIWN